MSYQKLAQQWPQVLSSAKNLAVAIAVIYGVYMASKAYKKGDEAANEITKPAGDLLSDITAWSNGNHRIEVTDLVIQPWYLDSDYRISNDAWNALNKIPTYTALMQKLFDDRILKPQYRQYIGKPISGA
ncbi:hypothetical protein [Shewanella maritima]|uniref:hypothetical protein n=1 Tax=Shewanella maritima TaxID=2520507 RepID=UPI003736F8ED